MDRVDRISRIISARNPVNPVQKGLLSHRVHFTFGATGLATGRTAVEQAVLGNLPALNAAQHRLFQAGAACAKPAPRLKCTLDIIRKLVRDVRSRLKSPSQRPRHSLTR